MKKQKKLNLLFTAFVIVAVAVINLCHSHVHIYASGSGLSELIKINQCQAEANDTSVWVNPSPYSPINAIFDGLSEEEMLEILRRRG